MRNSNLSELKLIDFFKRYLKASDVQLIKGIGDDAAVIKIDRDRYLLNTIDMLIEDKHFKSSANLVDVGYKSIACSLSDIAAMGGEPKFALVSLGMPKRFRDSNVRLLYKGFKKACDKFNTKIIGGDVNASDKLVIDISLLGFVKPKNLVLRGGAKIGDYIFVTGKLGGSIYGRHLKFIPRVKEASYLVNHYKLNAMIDISDGLVIDLWRVLKESNTGALIFEKLIPRSRDAKSLDEALYMGEDYELLFTASRKEAIKIIDDISGKRIKFPLSLIGFVNNKRHRVSLIDRNQREKYLKVKGFVHF